MNGPPPQDKPYRVYRAGDVPGVVGGGLPTDDTAPPRRRGRRARSGGFLLLAVVGVISAAAAGVAVGGGWVSPGHGTAALGEPGGPFSIASPSASAAMTTTSSPSPGPTTPVPPGFSVTAGGDVIGGFGVSDVVASMGSGLFKDIAPLFRKSDFGFVNLESPLTRGGEAQTWKDVVIKGNPDLAPAMAASGINVVTLANNHAGDMGPSGLLDTISHCRKNDIAVVGAGKDLAAAMSAAVLETEQGTTVAFLGFTDVLPAGYPATPSNPGVAPGRSDLGAVKRAIRTAAKQADFVVVGWHWNFEYKRAPSPLESSEGHAAVDAGADIVFAHHPHLLNGVEKYGGGLIFYSLGNLVFSGFGGETAETVIVRAKVSRRGIDAQLIPVVGGGSGVPRLVRGTPAHSILQRFRSFSASLGTGVKITGDRGYVHLRR